MDKVVCMVPTCQYCLIFLSLSHLPPLPSFLVIVKRLTPFLLTCRSTSSHLTPFHNFLTSSPLGILPPTLPNAVVVGLGPFFPAAVLGFGLVEEEGVGNEGWKCWNRDVEGREDSERSVNAVWGKFDSRRYYDSACDTPYLRCGRLGKMRWGISVEIEI